MRWPEIASGNRRVEELFSLRGKVALVTGGSGRYGLPICLALAEAGAMVVVGSREADKAAAAAALLRETADAEGLPIDLTSRASVQAAADQIVKSFGRVDVLVNNAARLTTGTLESFSDAQWSADMETNAAGLFTACQIFGNVMKTRGTGAIINMGSIYGLVSPRFSIYEGHPEMTSPPSYAFAKGGLVSLTRYLAVYLAPAGVRVNCITPGGLESPGMPEDFKRRYEARTPLGRLARWNDIKGATVFLASDASAYMTGQNVVLDGGLTAV
jgi:NAD(P)-dependent dehydrogenase (short-subunit alcohol dehydrogenase family)